jgi:chromosome segregation ATPase
LQEQFGILFNAVGEVSTDRKAGDRLNFRIKELLDQNRAFIAEKESSDRRINQLTAEKDQFEIDLKQLQEIKNKIQTEFTTSSNTMKDKINKLDAEIVQCKANIVVQEQKIEHFIKERKNLVSEKEKMK